MKSNDEDSIEIQMEDDQSKSGESHYLLDDFGFEGLISSPSKHDSLTWVKKILERIGGANIVINESNILIMNA